MSTGPRALILDCDGVLAETELDGHLVAFNRVFEELDLPFRWSADEYQELLTVGGGKERLLSYLAEHPEISLGEHAQETQRMVLQIHRRKSELYVELVEAGALPARPGIARLIGEALEAGWQVAVASTSAIGSVEAVLHSVIGREQRSRLSGVFAGDMVPAKKPAPDIYLMALEGLGRSVDEAVVIEDSGAGATAAARAGLSYIVTLSHFTSGEEFPGATTVVESLGEPEAPSVFVAGEDVRNDQGVVDVQSLERVLALRDAISSEI